MLCLTFLMSQCADDEIIDDVASEQQTIQRATTDCGCTYTVPASTNPVTVDGSKLSVIKPGAVICLKGTYKNIFFKNIRGTSSQPITIKNCGGTVNINATGTNYGIKTQLSSYIHITGGTGTARGIKVTGGNMSVTLEYLTTNVEVDHIEVGNSGFAGIMAKTDPTCDNATIRGNFTMYDVKIHDNYVHDTGGEGLYIGHSFWGTGVSTSCGQRYPHAIQGLKIYNNTVKNSGWESIQVGSAPSGAEVYNNHIENYGVANKQYQNNGVQFGEGAPGKFYGNFIKGGKAVALIIIGNGENFIHDNVIVNAGQDAVFVDDRVTGAGFRLINNTIINPGTNGIRLYSDLVPINQVYNNIIVNPVSYSKYTYPRTGNDAYVYFLNKTMPRTMLNNYFTRDIASVKFVNFAGDNYELTSSSPALNKGTNISSFNIAKDFIQKQRLAGVTYDIGAYEMP